MSSSNSSEFTSLANLSILRKSFSMSHSEINPAINYWGTPVVLITTENEDGTFNVAPMSSAWWLGNSCMLGLDSSSQTTINLLRTKQCVLNLPSDDMASHVNALARTTGIPVVHASKLARGYRHEKDKFRAASLTPEPSQVVRPARVKECPVQMEAELHGRYDFLAHTLPGFIVALEVKILRTYVVEELRLAGYANRIDPDRWRPMIMSFQHFYGLGDGKLEDSTLAKVEEELYRLPAKRVE